MSSGTPTTRVDDEVIYVIVTRQLGPLESAVRRLLDRLDAGDLGRGPASEDRHPAEEHSMLRTQSHCGTLTEPPYASWREFDPEDALRFFALQMHEVEMIKSIPQELIAEGTDWRLLNELKRELKA
jgi:hypothetical protein